MKNNKRLSESQRNKMASFSVGKLIMLKNRQSQKANLTTRMPLKMGMSTNGGIGASSIKARIEALASPYNALCLGAYVMNSTEFDLPDQYKLDNEFPGKQTLLCIGIMDSY